MVGEYDLDHCQIASREGLQGVGEVDVAAYSILVRECDLVIGKEAFRVKLQLDLDLAGRQRHTDGREQPTHRKLAGRGCPVAVVQVPRGERRERAVGVGTPHLEN